MSPTCPRCGYDLTGVASSWTNRCPLTGTCSECGLEFTWRDLWRGEAWGPAWSFEHAVRHRARRLFCTILMTFRPRRFWSSLRMEHWTNTPRFLFAACAGLVLVTLTLMGFLFVIPLLDQLWYANTPFFSWRKPIESAVLPWTFTDAPPPLGVRPSTIVAVFATFLIPASFVVLPTSLRRAKVISDHLWRALAYSLVPVALYLAIEKAGGTLAESATSIEYKWFGSHILWQTVFARWYRLALPFAPITLVVLYQFLWWSAFTGHYLRLPHARSVAAAMIVIAWGLSLLLGLFLIGTDLVMSTV